MLLAEFVNSQYVALPLMVEIDARDMLLHGSEPLHGEKRCLEMTPFICFLSQHLLMHSTLERIRHIFYSFIPSLQLFPPNIFSLPPRQALLFTNILPNHPHPPHPLKPK